MRIPIPLGSWYTQLRAALGFVHKSGYAPELGDVVVPVVSVNPGDTINNVATFADEITDAGQAFIGHHNQAAVAGQFGDVQIWNPAGSGKNVWIDYVRTGVQTQIRESAAVFGSAVSTTLGNKQLGGAAPVAELRGNASAGGTGTVRGYLYGSASEQWFNPPIKLVPGSGIHFEGDVVNTVVGANIQWRETTA